MRLIGALIVVALLAGLTTAFWIGAPGAALAQEGTIPDWGKPLRKAPPETVKRNSRRAEPAAAKPRAPERAPATKAEAKEVVEADVSTRSIAVTAAFSGTEIVVFGSVLNSRQPSAEAGTYDVIVVVEGMSEPLVARRKSNIAGLWVNTQSISFESAPSYYAVASTRPIEEIAERHLLERHAIGFEHVRLAPAAKSVIDAKPGEVTEFLQAVVRLKEKDGLYIKRDYAVIFIGKSLFRTAIALPANVPVGPLTARVYLFREGELLSTFSSRVRLEREGVELWLYRFAMTQPALYGLFAVMVAVLAGLIASMPFRRRDAA